MEGSMKVAENLAKNFLHAVEKYRETDPVNFIDDKLIYEAETMAYHMEGLHATAEFSYLIYNLRNKLWKQFGQTDCVPQCLLLYLQTLKEFIPKLYLGLYL